MRLMKDLRLERGLTQKQVAAVLGVSNVMVSHYERGVHDPRPDMRLRIATLFNTAVTDIAFGPDALRLLYGTQWGNMESGARVDQPTPDPVLQLQQSSVRSGQ